MSEFKSVKTDQILDPRVGFVTKSICSKCNQEKRNFFDKDRKFLYSSACECDLERERNERTKKLSNLLYGEMDISRKKAESGISNAEWNILSKEYILDNFNKSIYATMVDWVSGFSSQTQRGFLILGKPGTGKTRLALEIANKLLAKGVSIYFTTTQRYLTGLKHHINDVNNPDVFRITRKADVLILDDLGAERGSEFDKSEISELINDRLGKPTIITSNLHRDDMERIYHDRVISRLFEMSEKIIQLNGNDNRASQYKERNQ